MFRCGKPLIALALLMAIPVPVSAQTADNPPASSSQAQPESRPPPSAELLKPEQLEALVAPIALYPDSLLANMLAAEAAATRIGKDQTQRIVLFVALAFRVRARQ